MVGSRDIPQLVCQPHCSIMGSKYSSKRSVIRLTAAFERFHGVTFSLQRVISHNTVPLNKKSNRKSSHAETPQF